MLRVQISYNLLFRATCPVLERRFILILHALEVQAAGEEERDDKEGERH